MSIIEGDDPSPPEVVISWLPIASGTHRSKTDVLTATVMNTTKVAQSTRISITASGLDGQLVQRELATLTLKGGETRLFEVEVGELPIQTENSLPFVTLQVALERPGATFYGATEPLYYVFRNDYAEAAFYRSDDAVAVGAQLTPDPMAVRGRVMDARGTLVDVAGPRAVAGQGWQQGLTVMHSSMPAPPKPDQSSPAPALPAAALAGTARVCAFWRVRYVDSGGGEDFWPVSQLSWHNVSAIFAKARISRPVPYTVLWDGYLDHQGCTPMLSIEAGTYQFFMETSNQKYGTIEIRNSRDYNGSPISTTLQSGFVVTGAVNQIVGIYTTSNTLDIQTAALTGWVLNRHVSNVGGMGLPPATTFNVHANRLCPNPDNPGSCASGATLYVSPNLIAGWSRAYWKFNVLHEFGHAVRYASSGTPGYSYDDSDSTSRPLCRCNHVNGEQKHCLQSREEIGGAQNEGFAHAFAVRAFNLVTAPDATFVYYKEFLETAGVMPPPPPVVKNALSVPQGIGWMEAKCTPGQHAGRGVEWDWLTFYTNVTNQGIQVGEEPDFIVPNELRDIFKRMCTGAAMGMCTTNHPFSWSGLSVAAQAQLGPAKEARFLETGETHGVDH